MSDLVEQLRERADYEGYPGSTLTLQAADEIERLQARVTELEKAVAAEREECAKLCEGLPSKHAEMNYMHEDACMACAEAIRARGEKP